MGFNRIEFTREAELIEEADLRKQPILDLILAALIQPSFLNSGEDVPHLHNHDLVKLANGRIPESVVLRMIELYETEFDISRSGLVSLRAKGVSDQVIEAMLVKTVRGVDAVVSATVDNAP
jgi:hypothetical protein